MRLSIILPTYNEAENLPILIPKLIIYCFKHNLTPAEILILDDKSPDGTAKVARKFFSAALEKNINLLVIERKGKRGLIPAVIDGIKLSKGNFILIMDSDLSHPVNAINKLITVIDRFDADLSIGSRHCPSGSGDPNWPKHRRLISFFSGFVGRLLDWRVTDPMSGFLCFKRSFIQKNDLKKLKGDGFKILLEIIVKFKPKRIIECPIMFRDRIYGESKMNFRIIRKYLMQLIKLHPYKIFRKFRFKNE